MSVDQLPIGQTIVRDPDTQANKLKVNSDGSLNVTTTISGVATETTLGNVDTSLNYIETNTGDMLIKQQVANVALASIDNKTPALVGGRIPVDISSMSVTVSNTQIEIANDVGNPVPVSGPLTNTELRASAIPTKIYGNTEGGNNTKFVSVSDEGHLEVSVQGPKSVFGEILTSDLTPTIQADFVYGLNTNLVTTAVTGSGTATSANQMGIASTTAAASSTAAIRPYRVAKYRPGQGINCRYTAMFTTGVANSSQLAGVMNGTVDGYGFGYNGSDFGVFWIRDSVRTWVNQSSWNIDKADGTGDSGLNINPTKLNIYRVQMGYLGTYGASLSILNPLNGQFVKVHQFSDANTRTTPTVTNPTMTFAIIAENTTNTSNIAVSTASFMVAIEGVRHRLGGVYGQSTSKSIAATQTNIITLRNNTTINGFTNRSLLRLRSVSVATAAAVPVILLVTKNATVGGTPAFTNVSAANSLAAYDTAGTTITGGNQVFNTTIGAGGNAFCDLTEFDIFILPGETLVFSLAAISGGASNHAIAVNWSEDV